MIFNQGDRIVFIGDSITNSYKDEDKEGIGWGYVRLIRDYLWTKFPDKRLEIINKGVNGNRIIQLVERWKTDVINLQPNFLSILIGINDVWRQLDHPEMEQVSPERFENEYRRLIVWTKEKTKANLILMEPTIIEEDPSSKGNQLLKPYTEIVKRLSSEYGTIFIPTHHAFIKQLTSNSDYRLTTDGVHMTSIGNMLLARSWLEGVLKFD